MQQINQYLTEHASRFVDELRDFLRIRSVSADSAYRADLRDAAEFVRKLMEQAGLQAELVETAGNPIVHGQWLGAKQAPTALVYGHYDVQPPDPLDQWITPPFEPTIRDGKVFARGATDDKGQLLTHLKSIEAWLATVGRLPVNVHVIIEGEEEVGSKNLEEFLTGRREQLRCDVAVISDTSQFAPNVPAITYGLRGILACEVTLTGPSQDLHSGVFGGSIANPVNALATLVGAMHDRAGRVQIPGFYDDVVPLTADERARFAELPFDEAEFLRGLGVAAGWGEAGYSTLERRWARPTCDVNGLFGGYQGEGPKTIVPSRATAKITCRLVPRQDPAKITEALKQFLLAQTPPGLKLDFKAWHGCEALVFDPASANMRAGRAAIKAAFGVEPVMIREGGSIPVVATFRDVLGVDTLLLGWGQNTDNPHSPNEHFSLADFQRGIKASAYLWKELEETSPRHA